MRGEKKTRRADIDWLRTGAMFVIFLFHCARFFDFEGWHIKNFQTDLGMSIFVAIVSQWIMPLFFILSGISARYALRVRSGTTYCAERFKRLVIPLVVGTFTLIPPQVYIERVSTDQFTGSFFEFYPHYFDGFYGFGGNFAWMGLHLWYLLFLFVFSLATLPLFRWSERHRREDGNPSRKRHYGEIGVYLFVIPVILIELLVNLRPEDAGIKAFGGWSPVTYLVFFILGFFLARDEGYRKALERWSVVSLIGAVAITTWGAASEVGGLFSSLDPFPLYLLTSILRPINSWLWLMTILGFGSVYLKKSNKILRYTNEAVLPFYILHQTVIVIIGFFIAEWRAAILIKYLVLASSSFAVIMILYELLIRRIGVLRFLFGMKKAVGR
jgi:surface polysaccharide O-acyltransferase-like enzyme